MQEHTTIKPRLVKDNVTSRDFAVADLELLPGLVIPNILYFSLDGGLPKVYPPIGDNTALYTHVDPGRLIRSNIELPGWLLKWVAEEFEVKIEQELRKRGEKFERRRGKRVSKPSREEGDVL